jgi:hypothetical protein
MTKALSILVILIAAVSAAPPPGYPGDSLVRPSDFIYLGAFRLPDDPGWEYSGYGMTYRSDGDLEGAEDGFPGSLFVIGHDQEQLVAEVTIPAPGDPAEGVDGLPRAEFLQGFADITGGMFGPFEIARGDIEYVQGGSGALFFCRGQHFQSEPAPVLGLCRPDLDDPHPMGPWMAGEVTPYATSDYLFAIPDEWSGEHLPGACLACGRFRDGTWGGLGPAIVALVPSEMDLPPPGGEFEAYPLVMYGEPTEGTTELQTDPSMAMELFGEADEWSGGAWITASSGSAVILAGTKALGRCWYGYSNGVEYPTSGDPSEPIPELPPWPWNDRGWWSVDTAAGILFYDPADLAAVLDGEIETWDPQPYAFMAIDSLLADPGMDLGRSKRYSLGACAFDREDGILYVVERMADGDRSIIHAFRIE